MSAVARWNAFLTQIDARHLTVCKESYDAAIEALPQLDYDLGPIAVGLGAVRYRLLELESKIRDVWDAQVDAALEAEGVPHAQNRELFWQGEKVRRALERRREGLEPHAQAFAARALYARAMQERTDLRCARCGAPLSPPVVFRAIELRCESCHAVGVFEPGSLLRQVEAVGSHALAWVASEGEWAHMQDVVVQMSEARSPTPLALLQAYEHAQIAYWHKYFSTKAVFVPEIAQDVMREVRSRLEQWYTYNAEHEEEWRAAGRPRRI